MNREFYWEYLQECDSLVERFVSSAKETSENVFWIGNINLEMPVSNFIWEQIFFGNDRSVYSELRALQLGYSAFIQNIWRQKLIPLLPDATEYDSLVKHKMLFPFATQLKPFRNSIIFYCIDDRQLEYYRPILEAIDVPVVILTRKQLNELSISKPNIQIIEYELLYQEHLIKNDYILNTFPLIFYIANTLKGIINSLSPHCVIFLEGCHFETEIASSICKSEKIPSVCIQQGWPSLIHTRFKNMSYDYFLTWGKTFNQLWKNHNPTPIFKEVGYAYPVRTNTNKTAIAFFFQAPIFVIDEQSLDQMMQFLIHCAAKYTERKILLREHPQHKLDGNKIITLKRYGNIEIATDWPISKVFRQSEIGVSIFSSTLMEGIAHETIPFVFNVTSNPNYYPTLSNVGIGIEVKSLNEAIKKIDNLIKKEKIRTKIKNNIASNKPEYFDSVDSKSVGNIVDFIGSLHFS